MEKYIALLRGINVGGNNIVSMPILREAFEKAGFCEVRAKMELGCCMLCYSDSSK